MAGDIEADIEGTAEALYRAAGLDTGEAADPVDLAERLLGTGAVQLVHARALPGTASLARVKSSWRIYVRSRASESLQAFAILHELGHYALGLDAPDARCDAVAAALLLPRRAFQRAAVERGADWSALAAHFRCTESAVALRWGEVLGTPLALVAPLKVRVRGEPYGWPESEQGLRSLARTDRPGLARARLRDDARRVVVKAG